MSSINEEQRFTNVTNHSAASRKKQTARWKLRKTLTQSKRLEKFFFSLQVLTRSNSMIKLSESNPTKVNLTIFLVFLTRVHQRCSYSNRTVTESLAQQSSSTPGHGSGSNELKKFNRVLGKVIFPRTIQNLKKYAYFLTCKRESQ